MIAGLCLWVILAVPPIRNVIEARLTTHVLVELIGLVVAGYWLGISLRGSLKRTLVEYNRFGAPGIIIVFTTGIFWMLPRWLDASLDYPAVAAAKFLTLPVLLGLPLALSWPQAGTIFRGFLKTNFISMLAVLSWAYITSPIRLCNSYLVSDQTTYGIALGLIATGLSLLWSLPLFFGNPLPEHKGPNHSEITSGSFTYHGPETNS